MEGEEEDVGWRGMRWHPEIRSLETVFFSTTERQTASNRSCHPKAGIQAGRQAGRRAGGQAAHSRSLGRAGRRQEPAAWMEERKGREHADRFAPFHPSRVLMRRKPALICL